MKRSLVALVLLAVPFFSVAQDSIKDSSKIIAMENLWNRAELNNDAPAVQLLLADDFVMTVAEGTLYNKAQIVTSVADKSYRDCSPVQRPGGSFVRQHRRRNRRLLRERRRQRRALGAPRTLHGYMDEPERQVAVRSQPLQRQASVIDFES